MPRALYHFKSGNWVSINCYQHGCERVEIPVKLGKKYKVHPAFINEGQAGRFCWQSSTVVKGFELSKSQGGSGYCECENCRTLFASVIVVSVGRGKQPLIFGYDPEPA